MRAVSGSVTVANAKLIVVCTGFTRFETVRQHNTTPAETNSTTYVLQKQLNRWDPAAWSNVSPILYSEAVLKASGGTAYLSLDDGSTMNNTRAQTTAAAWVRVRACPDFGAPTSAVDVDSKLRSSVSSSTARVASSWEIVDVFTGDTVQGPAAPTGLQARTGSSGSVLLRWSRASQGSFPLRYYRVYQSETTGGPYTLALTVEGCPPETAGTIGGLVNGRTYYFVVKAEDTEGNASGYSSEVSAKPVSLPPPSGIQAYSGPEQVSLYWVPPSGLTYPPPSGYHVYRGDESGGPYGQIDPSLVTVPHYVDGTVSQGSIYYHVLRALDSDAPPNQSFDSDEVSGGPGALPGQPGNLAVTDVGASHVSLDWDAAEAGTFPLTDYVAYRSPTSGGGYLAAEVVSGSPPPIAVTVSGLPPGVRQHFVVRARDQAYNLGPRSDEVQATPFSVAPPSGIAALSGNNRVLLTWAPPSGVTYGVAGYHVYRATQPGGPYARLTAAPVPGTSYVDAAAANQQTYYYVLRTLDAAEPPHLSTASVEGEGAPEETAMTVRFRVKTEHDGAETAGVAFSVTLTALDANEQVVTSYTGERTIAWSTTATASPLGYEPVLPAPGLVTFTAGIATVPGIALFNAGEQPTLSAADAEAGGPKGISAPLVVQAGAVKPNPTSTVEAVPSRVPADNQTTSTVTVTLRDAYGNPVSGKTVSVTMTGSGNTINDTPGNGPTQLGETVAGAVSGTVRSSTVQISTVTARDIEDDITLPSIQVEFAHQSAPTNLRALAGDERVLLVWTPPVVLPTGGYAIFRGDQGSGSEGTEPMGLASSGAHCYLDQARVANGAMYYYYVKAFDAEDPPSYSDASNEAYAMPQKPAVVAPSAPTGLVAVAGDGGVDLAWEPSRPGTQPVQGYTVYRSSSPIGDADVIGGTAVDLLASPGNLTAVAEAGSPGYANVTLYYKVTALNGGGQTLPSAEVSVTIGRTTSQVRLTWDSVPGATSYRIYVGTAAGQQDAYYTSVASAFLDRAEGGTASTPPPANTTCSEAGTRFTDPSAAPGTTAYYWVVAFHGSEPTVRSALSNMVAVTPAAGHERLPQPASVRAAVTAEAQGRFPDGTYATYVVTAFSQAGETIASPEVLVAGDSGQQVTVSWNAVPGAGRYRVYRGTYAETPPPTPANNENQYHDVTSGTSLVDLGDVWEFGTPPSVNLAHLSPISGPSAPGTAPTITVGRNQLLLTWPAAAPGPMSLGGYAVYRGTAPGGDAATPVATTTRTDFVDGDLDNGQTYYYTVKAFDSHSARHYSPASAEASGAPSATAKVLPPINVRITRVGNGVGLPARSSYYQVTALNSQTGETTLSTEASLTYEPLPGDANLVTWDPVSGAQSYRVYVGTGGPDSEDEYYAVDTNVCLDLGYCGTAGEPPTENTALPEVIPGPPIAVKAVAGHQVVTLSWSPPSENPNHVAGYGVYRGLAPGQEAATPIATLPATARSTVDRGLVNGKAYYYYLRAYDFDTPIPNYSRRSAEVTATPGAGGRKLAVLALSTDPEAILFIGNSRTVINGADVHSNGGVVAQGSATVQINADVYAVESITGDISTPGHAKYPNSAPQGDPGYALPPLPTGPGQSLHISGNLKGTQTVSPGAYTLFHINPNKGTVLLRSGVYYITGGPESLKISNGVVKNADSGPVTFVLAPSASFKLTGGQINLKSGAEYNQILFYAQPNPSGRRQHSFVGNCVYNSCGSLYLPSDEIDLRGTADDLIQGQVVAHRVQFHGTPQTMITYSSECAPSVPVTPGPRIISIYPSSGPTAGGTTVTLRGEYFQPGCSVWIGGPTDSVTWLSPSEVTAVTRPHAEGTVDVTLTNPDSQFDTLEDGYTFVAPPVIEPPEAPLLERQYTEGVGIELSWTCAQGSYPIGGYEVWKSTTSQEETYLTTTADASYIDLDYVTDHTYYYKVRAFDTASPANYSGFSNEVDVYVPEPWLPPPPPVLSAYGGQGVVIVRWPKVTPATDPVKEYHLFRGLAPGAEDLQHTIRIEPETGADEYEWTDTNVQIGTTYYHVAITVDSEDRTSGLSKEVSAQPYGLGDMPGPILFATAGNRQVLLEWHVPNPEPDHMPAGYKLYRGLASGAEGPQPVYEVQTTELAWEWTDTDVKNGTEYFYVVRYIDGSTPPVMSRNSNEASAIPSGLSSGVWVTFFPRCWLFPAPALTVRRTVVDEIVSRARLGVGWPGLSARVQGLLYVPENGNYELMAKVSFASWLYVDGELVIYVPGDWAAPYPKDPIGVPTARPPRPDGLPSGEYRSAPIFLTRGLHRIQYDRVGLDSDDDEGGRLELLWRRPGMVQFETIASEYLHHTLPIVNCVSPREISTGGGPASIHGLGFDQANGAEVTFDGVAVPDAAVVSPERATGTLPGHRYGLASLALTNNSDGRSGTLDEGNRCCLAAEKLVIVMPGQLFGGGQPVGQPDPVSAGTWTGPIQIYAVSGGPDGGSVDPWLSGPVTIAGRDGVPLATRPSEVVMVDGRAEFECICTSNDTIDATMTGPWAKAVPDMPATEVSELRGTSSRYTLIPGATTQYGIALNTAPPPVATFPFEATLRAKDQFGNHVTTDTSTARMLPAGHMTFYQDGTHANLTNTYPLVGGRAILYMMDPVAETVTLKAVNVAAPDIQGSLEVHIDPYAPVTEVTAAPDHAEVASGDNYTIGFRVWTESGLTDSDLIALQFAPGYVLRYMGMMGVEAADVEINGWPLTSDPIYPPGTNDLVLQIQVPQGHSIPAGGYVTVRLKNNKVRNPETAALYALGVSTSRQISPANSEPYEIRAKAARSLAVLLDGQELQNGTPDQPQNPIVITGTPETQTVAAPAGACYVYAVDQYGNLVETCSEPLVLTSSDPKDRFPVDPRLENGGCGFVVTFLTKSPPPPPWLNGHRVYAEIPATSTTPAILGQSAPVTVNPTAEVHSYLITAPTLMTVGQRGLVTIEALDACDNRAEGATWSMSLSSTTGHLTFRTAQTGGSQVTSCSLTAGYGTIWAEGSVHETVRAKATDPGQMPGQSNVIQVRASGATKVGNPSIAADPDAAGADSVHTVGFTVATTMETGRVYLGWPQGFDLSALASADLALRVGGQPRTFSDFQYREEYNQINFDPEGSLNQGDAVQIDVGTANGNRITNHMRPGTYGIGMLTDADNDPASANLTLVPGSAEKILIAM